MPSFHNEGASPPADVANVETSLDPSFHQINGGPAQYIGNIAIGSVTSGDAPNVTNSGTAQDAILNFVLQKGDPGAPGIGDMLASNNLSDLRNMATARANLGLNSEAAMPVFVPEDYGAVADNSTFDNGPAFAAMSAALNAAGGGRILFQPRKTYWLGAQTNVVSGTYQFPPVTQYPIHIQGCTKPVVVDLNGSTIRAIAGLKFGSFNPDGTVMTPTMPYYGVGEATPYYAVIRAETNSGGVLIKNGELDGNINNLVIGGQWGDTGWQLPQIGIMTDSNTCPVIVENIYSHHQGQDGIESAWAGITAATAASHLYPVILRDSRFTYNGRQGWSFVGGVGGWAYNCDFSHTAQNGAVASSPSSGIDLESESSIIRNIRLIDCRIEDNANAGLLQVGDTADVEVHGGKIVGSVGWSIYGGGPYTRFYDVQITGAGVNQYGSTTDPKSAQQFHNCKFLFGLTRSSAGTVYGGGGADGYMWNGGGTSDANILWNNCIFDDEGTGVALPWTAGALGYYKDCHFKLSGTAPTSYPRGTFLDVNTFDIGSNTIDMTGSSNYGRMLVNGTDYYHTILPAGIQVGANGIWLDTDGSLTSTPGMQRNAAYGLALTASVGTDYDFIVFTPAIGNGGIFGVVHGTKDLSLFGGLSVTTTATFAGTVEFKAATNNIGSPTDPGVAQDTTLQFNNWNAYNILSFYHLGTFIGQLWSTDTGFIYDFDNHTFRTRLGSGGTLLATLNTSGLELAVPITAKPAASATPANNGDMTFELTSDTTLTVKVKGSDGTVRSVALTLA